MSRLALIGAACLWGASSAWAADIPLYPTGPSEDSAFLRFFNAGSGVLELKAQGSGASLSVSEQARASDFLSVPAGKPVKGSLKQGGHEQALDVSVEPGEFATVFGLPDAPQGLRLVTLREQPDDFNALKASLAFYSLDASCADAGVQVAGRAVDIFKGVADGSLQRRSINPLKLAVQLRCAGASVGAPLELGELAAGQRYSLFLVPSAQGPKLFWAQDTLSN
ncbi:alginate O-acetyltransferase AlgF [Pseudomonas sp. 8Z]|uniref:alginate O-acetyltransferase AlgF n=1 Tax=Pseudomonas sp. 8Z TaxID=2653166 RepID=UPI00135A2043|nr:alginate O-acetyltransferase AlgF [Pseudomonas sp. 8Z]